VTPRATAGWIAAAAVCLVVVWVDTLLTGGRPVLPERPSATPNTPPLLDVPPGSVTRVEWSSDSDRLTLVRTSKGWNDAAGHPWPADVVDSVLASLASLHPHTVLAGETADLAEYGLAPARGRLLLSDAGGVTLFAMEVGDRNPAWTGYYARREGRDEVMLVGALLRRELDKLRAAREDTVPP
jgi:hypothetical protein